MTTLPTQSAIKLFSILLALSLTACFTRHADLSAYSQSKEQQPTRLFKTIEYDSRGRPVFTNPLKERTVNSGEKLVVAQFAEDKPLRSFEIVVTSERVDMTRPFRVIYEWTGKGFRTAVEGSKNYTEMILRDKDKQTRQGESTRLDASEATFAVGPAIMMSIGGFIVGLATSIPSAIQEVGHAVISGQETVISYSTYQYDDKQRLSQVKTYLPNDIVHEIIKTDYFYQIQDAIPSKTEITSYPENTIRTIP